MVVAITADEIRCASVGDSEAWLILGGEVDELTDGQRRKPLLGSGGAIPANAMRPRRPGLLLISSDGLFRYASREKIVGALQDGPSEATLHNLVDCVRLRSGALQDDVAIALLKV